MARESRKKSPDVRKLADAFLKSAQAMHRVIPLERQARNIDAKGGVGVTLEEALKNLEG